MKGNLVIGQSGGPTAVINSSVCGAVDNAMRHTEIENIYGMLQDIQDLCATAVRDFGKASDR